MSFVRFEHLLERTMGLSAASIGASAVERAVQARLRACGLNDADHYWEQILRSPDEVQHLVEAVVVPETWFFRDPAAFAAMVRVVMEEWLPAHATGVLRLLSLPCSTGEEPYTMAMALIDAGLPTDRFRIDAIDISGLALAIARRGIYGGNSFRGQHLAFRERHFEPAERGCRIGDAVRGPVRFLQGNLLGVDVPGGGETYDVVFCRNLLIYFDVPTQNRAVGVLKRLLAPQGMLFVGHSEASLMLDQGLVSARMPMAFAFRKGAMPSQLKAKPAPARPAFQPKAAVPKKAPSRASPAPSPAFKRAAPPRPGLELAELRRIADLGQLAEAARGCQEHMRERGASPEAFLLLGLISDAGGNLTAAAGHYRKALYLEPDHAETLGHLALLLKKLGDVSGAKVLSDRMRRLAAKGAG
jgi:chemotaxis protein methyltransferase WspC